ncbi:hypothetical protein IAE16_02610 [Hydrogenobacter sp. T-2]|uniref:hypothetical protein n=1 Tax=Pampinifervens diazotrophicum TaxID=1632018 RepID=UPI002B260646|nr:hypothetical protein [Hydrogenobacter sp. T-2]WPM32580.1 hypothetical protein IAE16_02610 [Hydrogenobacter sp. T-2]
MPIVVRPEDIRLPKRMLRKDILYRLGLEEGKQIGLQEGRQIGKLEFAQNMVITLVESKLGYVPEGLEERVREIKDRDFLHALIKELISSEKVLEVLKKELNL